LVVGNGVLAVTIAIAGCERDPLDGTSLAGNLGPGQGPAVQGGAPGTGTAAGGASGSGAGGAPSNSGGSGGGTIGGCMTISTASGVMNPCGRTVGVAFSPEGQLVATATQTPPPNIHLWRLSDGAFVRDLEGHSGGGFSVAFSPDGKILATAGEVQGGADHVNDPTIVRLWDVATGGHLRDVPAGTGFYADSAQFSHDGTLLATAGYWGPIQIWRVADGLPLTSIPTSNTVYSARFSTDDQRLASAPSLMGGVWNASDGSSLFSLPGLGEDMNDAAFSPAGDVIATTGAAGRLQIFDAAGTLLQAWVGHDVNYTSRVLWVGPDQFVSDDWGGNVKSWTRDASGTFGPSGSWSLGTQAMGTAVSPDGARLVVGTGAGFVFLAL
jgi:WD40 repeat protein